MRDSAGLSWASAVQEVNTDAARDVKDSLHTAGFGDTHASSSDSVLPHWRKGEVSVPLMQQPTLAMLGEADFGDWHSDDDQTSSALVPPTVA
mmetsp:Transcript_90568/g.174351  ORF Transcript_90568/g.174351 Transcript_90568/m.174351 type:complete len:92 (-) Transcript_90568:540-815(-)